MIAQIPTAQQIIPLMVEEKAANAPTTSYEYEPEEDDILARLLPRNIAVQIFRALLENNASFYGAQMSCDGQRDAQRGRNDPQANPDLQPNPSGQITKELIEIISGAEAVYAQQRRRSSTEFRRRHHGHSS